MSVVDIFTEMSSHVIEGTMFHESLMKAYLFLNLEGYAACQEYHYLSESFSHAKLCKFVSNHINTIVSPIPKSDNDVIPKSWISAKRSDISPQVRKEAIRSAFHKWLQWEEDTVSLYERLYKEAATLGDTVSSEFIKSYILDAESELVYARNELIAKEAMGFDIVSILEEQKFLEVKFRKRIRKIGDERDEDE